MWERALRRDLSCPGGGAAIKAARAAEHGVEAARAAKKAPTGRGLGKAPDSYRRLLEMRSSRSS